MRKDGPSAIHGSFIPQLIEEQIAIEKALLQSVELSEHQKIDHTRLIYNNNCSKVERVILWVHGFLVSNQEGQSIAQHMVDQHPNTVVICFATPGLMTLTPQEASALFTEDEHGSFIPEETLKNFYRNLALQTQHHKIKLSTHGTSFGGQLLLRTLMHMQAEEPSVALPDRISLYAPFLEPSPQLKMISFVKIALMIDQWLPFNLFESIFRLIGHDFKNNTLHVTNTRSIDKLTKQPINVLCKLLTLTNAFEKQLKAGQLTPDLKDRISIVVDQKDPELAKHAIETFTNHVVSHPSRISQTNDQQHIEERPEKMPQLTLFNGTPLSEFEKKLTTQDAILHQLEIKVLEVEEYAQQAP
jgi:hypothetical protein